MGVLRQARPPEVEAQVEAEAQVEVEAWIHLMTED